MRKGRTEEDFSHEHEKRLKLTIIVKPERTEYTSTSA